MNKENQRTIKNIRNGENKTKENNKITQKLKRVENRIQLQYSQFFRNRNLETRQLNPKIYHQPLMTNMFKKSLEVNPTLTSQPTTLPPPPMQNTGLTRFVTRNNNNNRHTPNNQPSSAREKYQKSKKT